MYCPKCGFQLPDDATDCFVCGWKKENVESEKDADTNNQEVEKELDTDEQMKKESVQESVINDTNDAEEKIDNTQIKSEENAETENISESSLDEIKIEVNESETDVESDDNSDEIGFNPEDLDIDFSAIQQKQQNNGTVKLWSTAIISFLAGALCALLVIGCINGTVMGILDRITNGAPDDDVKATITTYLETTDINKFTSVSSTYTRTQLISYYQQYASYFNIEASDFDFEVTNDKQYASLLKKLGFSGYGMEIKNIDNVDFYYTSSDEFNSYKETYKSYADVDGIQMFASANVSYIQKEQETTTAEETTTAATTTKKSAKNITTKKNSKKTTTTTTTTQPTTTTTVATTTSISSVKVTCVKMNGNWYVFNIESNDSTTSSN